MNKNKFNYGFKAVLGLAFVLVLGMLGALISTPQKAKADAVGLAVWAPIPTPSSITCTAGSSTAMIATSTGQRAYMRFTNVGRGTVYLGLGQNAATSSGITLTASSSWEMNQTNVIWEGSVFCLSDSNTTASNVAVDVIGN